MPHYFNKPQTKKIVRCVGGPVHRILLCATPLDKRSLYQLRIPDKPSHPVNLQKLFPVRFHRQDLLLQDRTRTRRLHIRIFSFQSPLYLRPDNVIMKVLPGYIISIPALHHSVFSSSCMNRCTTNPLFAPAISFGYRASEL